MIKLCISSIFLLSSLDAIELKDYFNTSECDQLIDMKLYNICYSYKNKGAIAGWAKLYGDKVNDINLKVRPRYYPNQAIPVEYRTHYEDYAQDRLEWNYGHFAIGDADLDYSKESIIKAYSMANIIPLSAKLNQKIWAKAERYGRLVASKIGYVNSITIADYGESNRTVGNNIHIPNGLYRIYYNNDKDFEKCFFFENKLIIDIKSNKLKNHVVDCSSINLLI